MKRTLKFFSINRYSFLTKVFFSFLIFIFIFVLIRTSLSIPKIKEQTLLNEIEYITKSLVLLQEQIQIVGKSLRMQKELEVKLSKLTIENEVKTLDLIDNSKESILKFLKNSKFTKECSYRFSSNNLNIEGIKKGDYLSFNNIDILQKWEEKKVLIKNKKDYKKRSYYFYNYKKDDILLSLSCTSSNLNHGHMAFEKNLKKHIHTDLIIDSKLSSTKTAFVWISPKIDKNSEIILYEKDKSKREKKYNISMLSNVKNIPTGKITIKEFFRAAKTKKPILHEINNKKVYTWIIGVNKDDQKSIFIVHTINKKQLENKNKTKILFLFPETLVAIGISFLLLLFLLRRIIKNIDTLTKTAIKVNQGEKNIRSDVKGEDDIGTLGKSFDSMLDFFENSIETLDKKVQEKTKEISKSLDEKEVLLKEIHHRVKNNLALTISFIELQEDEIEDEKVKKVLVDIKERIYTMELLHRKLYESTNLNKISLKEYAIDLINSIAKTYDNKNKVLIILDITDIKVDIKSAMACGLILNELITNAYKHAFKENKNPQIKINITKSEDNFSIIVKDNGKGFSKNYKDCSKNSLGLRLIETIVSYQLFGKIVYSYEKGAKFEISGKVKDI